MKGGRKDVKEREMNERKHLGKKEIKEASELEEDECVKRATREGKREQTCRYEE